MSTRIGFVLVIPFFLFLFFFFFSIQCALIFSRVSAKSVPIEDPNTSEFSDSALKIELDQLKSRISTLESRIEWTANGLDSKEGRVTQLEKIIQEKLGKIALLQSEIESLKEKRSRNARENVGMAQTTVVEIERQVENYKKEVQTLEYKKEALEAQYNIAEEKMQQLNLKLQDLQKINNEQRIIIRKTEQALQVEEGKLLKTKLYVASVSKELREIDRAWIRHCFGVHMLHFQNIGVTYWKVYGRSVAEKASHAKDDVLRFALPHLKTLKKDFVEPIADFLTTKSTVFLRMYRNFISKEDLDQLLASVKYHSEKVHFTLNPYMKRASAACKSCMKSVMAYHWQLEAAIREKLSKTKFMDCLPVDEVAKLAATALMTLPILILLLNILLARFSGKPKKRVRHHQPQHKCHRARYKKWCKNN